MATYVPNASTLTEPTSSRAVGSAAEEFRVLKTSLDTRADLLEADMTAAEAAIDALEVDVAALELQMSGIQAGTDSTALAANLASTTAGNGAALLGVQDAAGDWQGITQEAVNEEIGFLLIRSGPINAASAWSDNRTEWAAIQDYSTTTDHQTILADLIGNNSEIVFPSGRYNGSANITVTHRVKLHGGADTQLRFTDGPYTALRVTGAGAAYFSMDGIYLRGTNGTNPDITLLRQDTTAGYSDVRRCRFAYADLCMDLDGVYITTVDGCMFAVANRYWRFDDSTYGVAANQFSNNKYATPVAGNTDDLIYIAGPNLQMSNEYFEPQMHTCTMIRLATGVVRCDIDAHFEAGGDVVIESGDVYLRGRFANCWKTSDNRTLRVNSGAVAYVDHSQFSLATYDAALTGISSAGTLNLTSSDVYKYGVGVAVGGGGKICTNQIRGCGTGVSLTSGSTALLGSDNTYLLNTTDVVNNSGGTAAAPGSFTASLTGCTAAVTGTARYVVNSDVCTLYLPVLTGTSNATSATITGLPVAIQPSISSFGTAVLSLDNGAEVFAQCDITGGTLTLYRNGSATGWAAAGTKGVRAQTITYRKRNV